MSAFTVDLLHLGEALEPDRDASAELAESGLGILQPFNPTQRVELIDMKPDPTFARRGQ